jgi:hypothetical protein
MVTAEFLKLSRWSSITSRYMITVSRRNSDKVTNNVWLRTYQLQFDCCWKLCMRAYNDQYGDRRISQALISRNLHVLCPFSNIPHNNNMISGSIGMLLSTKKGLLFILILIHCVIIWLKRICSVSSTKAMIAKPR